MLSSLPPLGVCGKWHRVLRHISALSHAFLVQRILHPDTAVQSLPTMAVHVMDSKFAVGPVYDARGDAYVNALTSEPTAEIQAIWGDKS